MSHCDISLCVSVNSPSLASGSLHRVNSPLVTIENGQWNRFRGEASDTKRVKNFVKNQQQPPKCLLVCLQKCHHRRDILDRIWGSDKNAASTTHPLISRRRRDTPMPPDANVTDQPTCTLSGQCPPFPCIAGKKTYKSTKEKLIQPGLEIHRCNFVVFIISVKNLIFVFWKQR